MEKAWILQRVDRTGTLKLISARREGESIEPVRKLWRKERL